VAPDLRANEQVIRKYLGRPFFRWQARYIDEHTERGERHGIALAVFGVGFIAGSFLAVFKAIL
jgi:hypothetical protein